MNKLKNCILVFFPTGFITNVISGAYPVRESVPWFHVPYLGFPWPIVLIFPISAFSVFGNPTQKPVLHGQVSPNICISVCVCVYLSNCCASELILRGFLLSQL